MFRKLAAYPAESRVFAQGVVGHGLQHRNWIDAWLGHTLPQTYGGHVECEFSHENTIARVTWQRDDA